MARWSLGEAEAEEAVEADIEAEEEAGAGPGYEVQMSTIFREHFTIYKEGHFISERTVYCFVKFL